VGEDSQVWDGEVQDGFEGWIEVRQKFDSCLGVSLSLY
jgi:hypothetical protein